MPLEIKELHVKINVEGGSAANNAGKGAAAAGPDEAIVKACVEKVMEILKEKTER